MSKTINGVVIASTQKEQEKALGTAVNGAVTDLCANKAISSNRRKMALGFALRNMNSTERKRLQNDIVRYGIGLDPGKYPDLHLTALIFVDKQFAIAWSFSGEVKAAAARMKANKFIAPTTAAKAAHDFLLANLKRV